MMLTCKLPLCEIFLVHSVLLLYALFFKVVGHFRTSSWNVLASSDNSPHVNYLVVRYGSCIH